MATADPADDRPRTSTVVLGPILCAVDFSAGSDLAVERARRVARDEARALIFVHVFHPPRLSFSYTMPTAHNLLASIADDARARLSRICGALEPGESPPEQAVLEGEPWHQIVDLARRRGAALIVLGAHGQSSLSDVLLGSVAERVVRHAPCSVLVARPDVSTASR